MGEVKEEKTNNSSEGSEEANSRSDHNNHQCNP